MIGEMEKIVSEAMTVVQENTNGMMTSVVRNIQSYVKSQVYQLINMITRDGKQGQYKIFCSLKKMGLALILKVPTSV